MAYDSSKLEIPADLEEALPDMISKAISHTETAYGEMQEKMTEFYKGDLPGITQEDYDDGRSDIVSRDVHDAVMATMPDLIRCFTGADHVVEFEPGGPDDEEYAEQATDAVRHIFEKENDGFGIIHGSLKDGLVRKFAVATWWHEFVDESYVQSYSMPEDEFVMFLAENEGEVEVVESKVTQHKRRGPMVKAKLRHIRETHKYNVDLVPPEELIISPAARTARGDHLIGRRQNLRAEVLIGMGYDEDLIEESKTSDASIETSGMAAARAPNGQNEPDAADKDEILYVECYVRWPEDGAMRLFKICTLGDGHKVVACEPVDEVNMALFTPDPEPHTPVGESQAEKVQDIQRLKTGVWRGIIDSLAEALVPRTEIVEGQVNIDDAMSTEIGGLIRTRQPNMVRPISTPFVGQQAIPLLDSIDNMREERVGAFRAADGLSAEAMQSSTKMAVAATITGSKAQKELLAKIYAETFLKRIFRGLLKLFVQHQDREKMMKLRGTWVPVDPRGWNADMDATVEVMLALTTPEEKAQHLGGIAEKQELILQQMGPDNPVVSLAQYAETLREMVRLTGRKNVDKYFKKVDPNWKPAAPQTPPDPALVLAQAQAQALGLEQTRKDAESAHKTAMTEKEHKDKMDLERDKLDQERSLKLLELAGQFGVDTKQTEAKIIADITKHRDMLASQERQLALTTEVGAIDKDAQRAQDAALADRQQQSQAVEGDKQRQFQAAEGDKQRQAENDRHALDAAASDMQHERSTQAQKEMSSEKVKSQSKARSKK